MRFLASHGGSTVVAIGEFDGCHLGHQRLLELARQLATRHRCAFDALVLDRSSSTGFLMDPVDRARIALRSGALTAAVLPVEVNDNDTVVDIVQRQLDPSCVVIACPLTPEDARTASLSARFAAAGIPVVEAERVFHRGEPVTSNRMRSLLLTGDVESLAELTGHIHEFSATVCRGDQLGRTIGFPTANLPSPRQQLLPARGVYAGYAVLADGRVRNAAINIGTRPTVSASNEQIVEAHLVDFDGDLYGETLTLGFTKRLRGEQRFDGLDALTAQLGRDVATTTRLDPSRHRTVR